MCRGVAFRKTESALRRTDCGKTASRSGRQVRARETVSKNRGLSAWRRRGDGNRSNDTKVVRTISGCRRTSSILREMNHPSTESFSSEPYVNGTEKTGQGILQFNAGEQPFGWSFFRSAGEPRSGENVRISWVTGSSLCPELSSTDGITWSRTVAVSSAASADRILCEATSFFRMRPVCEPANCDDCQEACYMNFKVWIEQISGPWRLCSMKFRRPLAESL